MPTTGKVKWFDKRKGWGFIELDDGSGDVFVHFSAIQDEGFRTLKRGEAVNLEVIEAEKGKQASKVIRSETPATAIAEVNTEVQEMIEQEFAEVESFASETEDKLSADSE